MMNSLVQPVCCNHVLSMRELNSRVAISVWHNCARTLLFGESIGMLFSQALFRSKEVNETSRVCGGIVA
jgi:hypothetical protein